MAGAQGHRPARIGPHYRALLCDYLERSQRAGVFRNLGVDQIGKRHRYRRLHIGMRGIDKARRLRIGIRQVNLDVAACLRDLGGDPDIATAMTVIIEERLAVEHAVFPCRNHRPRLRFSGVKDRLDRRLDNRRAEFRKQP